MKKARRKRYDACDELEVAVKIDIFDFAVKTLVQSCFATYSWFIEEHPPSSD